MRAFIYLFIDSKLATDNLRNNCALLTVSSIENRRREIARKRKRQKLAAFLERRDDVTYARSPRLYNRERAVCRPRSYKPKTVCRFFEGTLIFVAGRFSTNLLLRDAQKRGTCRGRTSE